MGGEGVYTFVQQRYFSSRLLALWKWLHSTLKGWAHGPALLSCNYFQQLGRYNNWARNFTTQQQNGSSQCKPPNRLQNAIKAQPVIYPNAINTTFVYYPAILKPLFFIMLCSKFYCFGLGPSRDAQVVEAHAICSLEGLITLATSGTIRQHIQL